MKMKYQNRRKRQNCYL